MKFFYLITKSESGGPQTHLSQLGSYLIGKGHEVAIMAYPGGWLEGEAKRIGIKFYPNRFLDNSIQPVRELRALFLIEKALADFKPDLLSCHSTKAGILGRLAPRFGMKTLFTAHGWAFTEGVPAWREFPVTFLERLCANFCSKIICVSEHDRQLALRYKIASGNKFITVHNGVEVVKEIPAKDYSGKLKIVFTGRLVAPKDPFSLVKAVSLLPEDLRARVEVAIVGGGSYERELRELINQLQLDDKVKMLGALPRSEVFKVLAPAHIFALISDWEGLPRSILEAMSSGMVTIASEVGGVAELVDESSGFLVKRRDVEGVKGALIKLLSDPGLIKEMGEKAHQKALEQFSLEKMIESTVGVYEEMLSRKI
jgi:glycosyltransferase involved in cell wall biosynthesis